MCPHIMTAHSCLLLTALPCALTGAPIANQKSQLRRGVDVAVGTPGRIIDLIENGNALDLSQIKCGLLILLLTQQRFNRQSKGHTAPLYGRYLCTQTLGLQLHRSEVNMHVDAFIHIVNVLQVRDSG